VKLDRLASILTVVALTIGAFAFSAPAHAVTVPTISQSYAATGVSVTTLPVVIPVAPLHGDALVVFEWWGTNNNPCNYVLPPTDSQSQSWGALGNCQVDGLGVSGMQAFAVASYSSNQPDTVNCNYGGPNTAIEACYVFDVATPGVITLLGSAKGYSNIIQLPGNPLTAQPYSLILATAGMETACQAVAVGSTVGFGGGGQFFNPYSPASACYPVPFGMSGEWIQTGAGGISTNFNMGTTLQVIWNELVVQVAQPTVVTTTTNYSATVVGWLVPDSKHFSNTLILIILPLMGMVFGIFPFTLGRRPSQVGDRVIFPALIGLTLGSALADLTVSNTSVLQIPFADIVVAAALAFLWWWNS
jgi:hypothetical protein